MGMRQWRVCALHLVSACVVGLCGLVTGYGQNGAMDLVSSTTIYNQTQPFVSSGAVAGFFHHSRKLDFVFGGVYAGPDTLGNSELATNKGNGIFSVSNSTNCAGDNASGSTPTLATDLNGDGVSDVPCTYANNGQPGFQINYGDGNGGFSAVVQYQVDAAKSNVLEAVAADFDGDGRTDIAVLAGSNRLVILLNKESKVFQPSASYPLPYALQANVPIRLAAGKLNGGNQYDLVLVAAGPSARMTPYFAIGGGDFRQGTTVSIGAAISAAIVSAAIGDVNKDGYGDVAVATDRGVKLLLGSSSGSFRAGASIGSGFAGCAHVTSQDPQTSYPGMTCLVLADFNKDGKLDLAVTSGSSTIYSPPNRNLVNVYFGNGMGGFGNPATYSVLQGTIALIAGDVNGTDNVDLVVAHGSQAGLSVLRNDGAGHFRASPVTYSPNANGIVAGDFNRDGKPDAAIVSTPACKAPCNGAVTVFTGSGSTYLNAGRKYAIGMHGAAIAAGDLNRDGILDLVVSNATAGAMRTSACCWATRMARSSQHGTTP